MACEGTPMWIIWVFWRWCFVWILEILPSWTQTSKNLIFLCGNESRKTVKGVGQILRTVPSGIRVLLFSSKINVGTIVISKFLLFKCDEFLYSWCFDLLLPYTSVNFYWCQNNQNITNVQMYFGANYCLSPPNITREILFSLFSTTCLGNTKDVVLSRCRLLIKMTNGVKLLYYWRNTKTRATWA